MEADGLSATFGSKTGWDIVVQPGPGLPQKWLHGRQSIWAELHARRLQQGGLSATFSNNSAETLPDRLDTALRSQLDVKQ